MKKNKCFNNSLLIIALGLFTYPAWAHPPGSEGSEVEITSFSGIDLTSSSTSFALLNDTEQTNRSSSKKGYSKKRVKRPTLTHDSSTGGYRNHPYQRLAPSLDVTQGRAPVQAEGRFVSANPSLHQNPAPIFYQPPCSSSALDDAINRSIKDSFQTMEELLAGTLNILTTLGQNEGTRRPDVEQTKALLEACSTFSQLVTCVASSC